MEKNENEGEAIAVNLRMGLQQKRLWFSVGKDEDSKKLFESACKEIESIGDKNPEWSFFLKAVEDHFKSNGFERIAI